MSDAPQASRSFAKIDRTDLECLAAIATRKYDELFTRLPGIGRFRGRRFLTVLAQGAAEHFVGRGFGINDFDVWSFFDHLEGVNFPDRMRWQVDFGSPKFGVSCESPPGFTGRRVDLMARAVRRFPSESAATALAHWLEPDCGSRTEIKHKAIVGLWPPEYMGRELPD